MGTDLYILNSADSLMYSNTSFNPNLRKEPSFYEHQCHQWLLPIHEP
jgi:hypothetical protein